MKRSAALALVLVMISLILFPLLSVNAQEIYYITDESSLYEMEKDPNGIYYLANDIDISVYHETMFKNKENPFMGVFNGCGHSISQLRVKGDEQVVAFIGYSYGEISDVNFISATIKTENANAVVAGIVGYNYGRLTKCSFSGMVLKNGVLQHGFGVCGYNFGFVKELSEDFDSMSSETEVPSSSFINISGETFESSEVAVLSSETDISSNSESSSKTSSETSSKKPSKTSSKTSLKTSSKTSSRKPSKTSSKTPSVTPSGTSSTTASDAPSLVIVDTSSEATIDYSVSSIAASSDISSETALSSDIALSSALKEPVSSLREEASDESSVPSDISSNSTAYENEIPFVDTEVKEEINRVRSDYKAAKILMIICLILLGLIVAYAVFLEIKGNIKVKKPPQD